MVTEPQTYITRQYFPSWYIVDLASKSDQWPIGVETVFLNFDWEVRISKVNKSAQDPVRFGGALWKSPFDVSFNENPQGCRVCML